MPITLDDATADAIRPLLVQHVASLQSQIAALHKLLGRRRPGRPSKHALDTISRNGNAPRKRRKMTAAQRKAVGDRMRAYWRSRKARARRRPATGE